MESVNIAISFSLSYASQFLNRLCAYSGSSSDALRDLADLRKEMLEIDATIQNLESLVISTEDSMQSYWMDAVRSPRAEKNFLFQVGKALLKKENSLLEKENMRVKAMKEEKELIEEELKL
jgi:hypothetical protein